MPVLETKSVEAKSSGSKQSSVCERIFNETPVSNIAIKNDQKLFSNPIPGRARKSGCVDSRETSQLTGLISQIQKERTSRKEEDSTEFESTSSVSHSKVSKAKQEEVSPLVKDDNDLFHAGDLIHSGVVKKDEDDIDLFHAGDLIQSGVSERDKKGVHLEREQCQICERRYSNPVCNGIEEVEKMLAQLRKAANVWSEKSKEMRNVEKYEHQFSGSNPISIKPPTTSWTGASSKSPTENERVPDSEAIGGEKGNSELNDKSRPARVWEILKLTSVSDYIERKKEKNRKRRAKQKLSKALARVGGNGSYK